MQLGETIGAIEHISSYWGTGFQTIYRLLQMLEMSKISSQSLVRAFQKLMHTPICKCVDSSMSYSLRHKLR